MRVKFVKMYPYWTYAVEWQGCWSVDDFGDLVQMTPDSIQWYLWWNEDFYMPKYMKEYPEDYEEDK